MENEDGVEVYLRAGENYLKIYDAVTGQTQTHKMRVMIQRKERILDWGIAFCGGQMRKCPRQVSVILIYLIEVYGIKATEVKRGYCSKCKPFEKGLL